MNRNRNQSSQPQHPEPVLEFGPGGVVIKGQEIIPLPLPGDLPVVITIWAARLPQGWVSGSEGRLDVNPERRWHWPPRSSGQLSPSRAAAIGFELSRIIHQYQIASFPAAQRRLAQRLHQVLRLFREQAGQLMSIIPESVEEPAAPDLRPETPATPAPSPAPAAPAESMAKPVPASAGPPPETTKQKTPGATAKPGRKKHDPDTASLPDAPAPVPPPVASLPVPVSDSRTAAVIPGLRRPRRNRAILRLLAETGIQQQELITLNLSDISDEGLLTVRKRAGIRPRRITLSPDCRRALNEYIRLERPASTALFPASPALFLSSQSVPDSEGRLSPALVHYIAGLGLPYGKIRLPLRRN